MCMYCYSPTNASEETEHFALHDEQSLYCVAFRNSTC